MSAVHEAQLVLATGETITLSREEGDHLAKAISSRRIRNEEARNDDLPTEIAAFLERKPGSSTIEIARAIGARDSRVRKALKTDPQFENVPAGPGRSARLRAWIIAPVASQPGPGAGTTMSSTGSGLP